MENFGKINQTINWTYKVDSLLEKLSKNINIGDFNMESEEETQFICQAMEKFMDHNEEKYRDKEGREIFRNIRSFIENIKNPI